MSGRHRRGRHHLPLHVRDQFDAASDHNIRLTLELAQDMGLRVESHSDDDGTDPTLEAMIADLKARIGSGEIGGCPHLGIPQPFQVNLWEHPPVIRCLDTCAQLARRLNARQDLTCDHCGRIDPTGVWPTQVAIGPLSVNLGRCDTCFPNHP